MSAADQAIDFARRAVNAEARGHGDVEDAMHRLAARTGVGFWTWWGLWHRRRKGADLDLLNAVKGAYYMGCERRLETLKHELALADAAHDNDPFADLLAEAEILVAKLKAARAKVGLPAAPSQERD